MGSLSCLASWNKDILIGLANSIGHFVTLEKDFHLLFDKRTAKVLVEVDISNGLLLDIEIVCGDIVLSQWIDYLNMPFRCKYCHDIGHLCNSCTLLHKGHAINKGFDLSLATVSPSLPSMAPLVPTPEDIYISSSDTL